MIFKGWDWEKNNDNYWLTPDNDAYFLAERFQDLGYKDIFDLGVGLGRHSIFFARRGFRVKGIDVYSFGLYWT